MPKLWRRTKRLLLSLLAVIAALGAVLFAQGEYILLGAEGYIFGYPLVIMDLTRAASAHVAAENQLRRVREFPTATFHDVVRPNVDTLYTTAFIDTLQGPWVFEMPPNHQRYEVMPFMDGWTNVFASLGTRTTGQEGGRYLLVGPGWQGQLPAGFTLLRAPTQMVWLIGRTQTNGAADYATVHALQDGLRLRSLPDWLANRPEPTHAAPAPLTPSTPPIGQMKSMGVETFFTRLALLMVNNPAAAADGPMLTKLERIGVAPGQAPQWGWLDRSSVALGRWLADFTVAKELRKPRDLLRGWSTPPTLLGNYGTFYNLRAVVAMIGLGANLAADATYPSARVDASGQALNGSHRYRLHFGPGERPPVNAFWSVTAYDANDFLIDNPAHRYARGDRDSLVVNADGSLDLWIQAAPPPAERLKNWIPVKAGAPFLLNARLYWPQAQALDGRWGMPAVERLD